MVGSINLGFQDLRLQTRAIPHHFPLTFHHDGSSHRLPRIDRRSEALDAAGNQQDRSLCSRGEENGARGLSPPTRWSKLSAPRRWISSLPPPLPSSQLPSIFHTRGLSPPGSPNPPSPPASTISPCTSPVLPPFTRPPPALSRGSTPPTPTPSLPTCFLPSGQSLASSLSRIYVGVSLGLRRCAW